jgi:hypothetical protein
MIVQLPQPPSPAEKKPQALQDCAEFGAVSV